MKPWTVSTKYRVFGGLLLLLILLVLPVDPFEAFWESRMALPETTPQGNLNTLIDDHLTSPVEPRRLFRVERADLDNDGQEETYTLRDGRLTVTYQKDQEDQEGHVLWQSPEHWWIDDFILGDITNDGEPNLSLSVWREGSYGPYKPFWVKANDTLVRNHLFVYRLETAEKSSGESTVKSPGESHEEISYGKPALKAIWQSSHLARPNHRVCLAQIGGGGENHLMVVQGDYEDPTYCEKAYWKWNGWGFSPSP